MFGLNLNIPHLNEIRQVQQIDLDQIEDDISYQIGERIFLKSHRTFALGLPPEYLRGVEIQFGQAAKSVRPVVYQHLSDDLEKYTGLFWAPYCAYLHGINYAFAYVSAESLSPHALNSLIDWLNAQ